MCKAGSKFEELLRNRNNSAEGQGWVIQHQKRYMDQDNLKAWLEALRCAGEDIETVRREEMRAYDYAENQAIVDGMLQWACEHAQVRLSSGLVEQQYFFMKMRKVTTVLSRFD